MKLWLSDHRVEVLLSDRDGSDSRLRKLYPGNIPEQFCMLCWKEISIFEVEPSGSQTPRWSFRSRWRTEGPHYIIAIGLLGSWISGSGDQSGDVWAYKYISIEISHQNNTVYCNLTENTIIRINGHGHLTLYSISIYKRKWGPLSSWHSKTCFSSLTRLPR